jgi:hypothetical protein
MYEHYLYVRKMVKYDLYVTSTYVVYSSEKVQTAQNEYTNNNNYIHFQKATGLYHFVTSFTRTSLYTDAVKQQATESTGFHFPVLPSIMK